MSDTDDHADFSNDVRAALAYHSADQPTQAHDEHSAPAAAAAEQDAQASIDMGLAVAAQLNREDQQRAPEQSGKRRNERGRFISGSSSAAVHDGVASVSPSLATPSLKPPTSWSPEARNEWDRLPPAVQQAALKREEEMNQGVETYRSRIQQHEQIESMMAPRRQVFQQYGLKDSEAIERLLMVSDGLGQNPVGTLQFLAQQFGIGPQQLFPDMQQSAGPSQQQIDAYVQDRVQMAQAQAEVQRFEAAAPEHYSVVKGLMQQLLQRGAASNMQDAYRQACMHHPAVQSIEQQRQVRDRRDRQLRAANASLNGAPHGTLAFTPPRSNGRSRGSFGDVADDVRAALHSLS
jgi:hypothetical protein